ncbi:hypothetical protein ACFLZP_04130 [Patescibacteria group bacterium]
MSKDNLKKEDQPASGSDANGQILKKNGFRRYASVKDLLQKLRKDS